MHKLSIWDGVALSGAAAIVAGLYMIYPPLGWLVAGMTLVTVASVLDSRQ